MINLVTVISTEIKKARLFVKVLRYGKSDNQTPTQVSPYGIDSNPVKGMIAVYAKCGSDNNMVVVGYINKNSIAKVGELRMFSTDKDGAEKFYYYLKDDGTTEIGGDTNYAVKFNELKTEFNKLKQDFNDFVTQKYNLHTHPGGTISGNTAVTAMIGVANTSNIDNAKNDKIKTIG